MEIQMKLDDIESILSPGFGADLDHDVILVSQRSFSVDEVVAELRQESLMVRKKSFGISMAISEDFH